MSQMHVSSTAVSRLAKVADEEKPAKDLPDAAEISSAVAKIVGSAVREKAPDGDNTPPGSPDKPQTVKEAVVDVLQASVQLNVAEKQLQGQQAKEDLVETRLYGAPVPEQEFVATTQAKVTVAQAQADLDTAKTNLDDLRPKLPDVVPQPVKEAAADVVVAGAKLVVAEANLERQQAVEDRQETRLYGAPVAELTFTKTTDAQAAVEKAEVNLADAQARFDAARLEAAGPATVPGSPGEKAQIDGLVQDLLTKMKGDLDQGKVDPNKLQALELLVQMRKDPALGAEALAPTDRALAGQEPPLAWRKADAEVKVAEARVQLAEARLERAQVAEDKFETNKYGAPIDAQSQTTQKAAADLERERANLESKQQKALDVRAADGGTVHQPGSPAESKELVQMIEALLERLDAAKGDAPLRDRIVAALDMATQLKADPGLGVVTQPSAEPATKSPDTASTTSPALQTLQKADADLKVAEAELTLAQAKAEQAKVHENAVETAVYGAPVKSETFESTRQADQAVDAARKTVEAKEDAVMLAAAAVVDEMKAKQGAVSADPATQAKPVSATTAALNEASQKIDAFITETLDELDAIRSGESVQKGDASGAKPVSATTAALNEASQKIDAFITETLDELDAIRSGESVQKGDATGAKPVSATTAALNEASQNIDAFINDTLNQLDAARSGQPVQTAPVSEPRPASPTTAALNASSHGIDQFIANTLAQLAAARSAPPAMSMPLGVVAVQPQPAPLDPQGSFTTSGGPVSIDILPSTSGFDNKIYWSDDNFKTKNLVGVDNKTGTVEIGSFPPGTRIDFAVDNGQGDFFRSGDGTGNSDGQVHARASRDDQGTRIGFEDLRGGGDKDFDDAVIRVREQPATAPVATQPGPSLEEMQARASKAIEAFDGSGVNRAPFNNDRQLGIHELTKAGVSDANDSRFLRHGLGDGNGFINRNELVQAQKDGLITIGKDGKIALTDEGKMHANLFKAIESFDGQGAVGGAAQSVMATMLMAQQMQAQLAARMGSPSMGMASFDMNAQPFGVQKDEAEQKA